MQGLASAPPGKTGRSLDLELRQAGTRRSYSFIRRLQPSQNGAGSSPAGAGDQNVEVHVPAGGVLQQGGAVGQAAMDHGEQHLVALRVQLEGDVAAVLPGDGELARRIEFGDPALHAVFLGEAGRALGRRVGELVVAPDQLEGRADLHLHLARRQPLAAQIALREIRPDALDRAGQQALDLQRGGLGQHAVLGQLAVGATGRELGHGSSPFRGGDLRASSSRRSRSSTSRRPVQKRW